MQISFHQYSKRIFSLKQQNEVGASSFLETFMKNECNFYD